MNSKANWADRMFDILLQVKKVCEQSGITMFLFGGTALEAYRSQTLAPVVTVCIDISDRDRFLKAIEEDDSSNLGVEYILNNPRLSLRGPGAMVYDPETTDFNMFDFFNYRNNCLAVRVYFICHVPDNSVSRRVINGLLLGFNKKNERFFDTRDTNVSKLTIPLEMMEKVKGPEYVAEYVHEKTGKKMSGKTKWVRIGRSYLDADLFNKTTAVKIRDQEFLIPKETDKYFIQLYGRGWEYIEADEYKEGRYRFRSAAISWEDFRKAVPFDEKDYLSAVHEHNSAAEIFREYNREQHRYFGLLKRTDDRIQLALQLEPRKQELIEMKEAGEYKALKEALRPYLAAIFDNAREDLGLCFDKEIFELAYWVIEKDYGTEYAEHIRSLVPEKHWNNLQLRNYKDQNVDWKGNEIS